MVHASERAGSDVPMIYPDYRMRITVLNILTVITVLGMVAGFGMAAHHAQKNQHVLVQPATATPLPTALVHSASVAASTWKPRIAFQYYDGDQPSSDFLATHVDWLMMRYGAEDRRQDVYAHGYQGPVFQYILASEIEGPGPLANKKKHCNNDYTPLRNNAMWTKNFCQKVHPHESWFLHNGKGERLYSKETNWDGTDIYSYYMNPASEGFRAFWVKQIKQQNSAGWQAFFLDNVAVSYKYLMNKPTDQDGSVQEYTNDQDWDNALTGFLQVIRKEFPNRPLWGNMVESSIVPGEWEPFLPYLDGFQEENFATNWRDELPLNSVQWNTMITRAEQALALGKSVVLYGQGDQDDLERMRFSLASYMLVATADDRATFRYTHTGSYDELWWYPEYDMNFGLPVGKRYRQGTLWVRDYQCGRVTVDPDRHVGHIEQRPCHR